MNSNSDRTDLFSADTFLYLPVARELAAFFQELAILEPEIEPLITEHVRYFDEMLPSLLMGDIAR